MPVQDRRGGESSSSRALARAVSGLSLIACVGAGFAILREMAMATSFGAGGSVDAYLVAVTVPFLLGTSVISTLEAAFIPLYVSCKAEGGLARVTELANAANFWVLVGGLALMIGLFAGASLLLPLQAPGFPPERLALARHLVWFTAPSVPFACLYAVGRGVLNAERRFFAPAIAPAVNASVMIAVILGGWHAWGITAAGVAYTAGMAAMWLTVYVPIAARNLPGRGLANDWRNPDVSRLFSAARPLLLGVIAMSTIPVVDRVMASHFPAGVISALGYADRVVQIPITIVATAVTTATFPMLSRDAAQRDFDALRRTLADGIRLIAMLLIPIAVLFALLSGDIVAILFERGQFTVSDARTTAIAVFGLALGMAFMGTFQLVPRVFNALQLAPFVALSGVLNLGLKTAFNLSLVPLFGYVGFALATSAMYVGTGGIMLYLLSRRMQGLNLRTILPSFVAIGLGAALMTAIGTAVAPSLDAAAPMTRVMVVASVAGLAYMATVWSMQGRLTRLMAPMPASTSRGRAIREGL